jgi:hypothetical protein
MTQQSAAQSHAMHRERDRCSMVQRAHMSLAFESYTLMDQTSGTVEHIRKRTQLAITPHRIRSIGSLEAKGHLE